MRALESQIEDDYNERQKISKDKRDLERQIKLLQEEQVERDRSKNVFTISQITMHVVQRKYLIVIN